MRHPMRILAAAVVAAGVTTAAAVGIATADRSGQDRSSQGAENRATPASKALAADYGVFRRGARDNDAVPHGASAWVSRRAFAAGGQEVYLISKGQSDDGFCVALVPTGSEGYGGVTCGDASVASQTPPLLQVVGPRGVVAAGPVPDQVTSVSLETADGQSVKADIRDNGFIAVLPANARVKDFVIGWSDGRVTRQ